MELEIPELGKIELDSNKKEKILKKAINEYSKGEKFLFKRNFKSAEGHFKKAFDNFMKLEDTEKAEKVLIKLAECYIIEKQYLKAANTIRDTANLRLLKNKYINAVEQYRAAIELLLKLDLNMDTISKILEIVSFISLCYLAVGDFEKGTEFLKKNIQKYTKNLKNKLQNKILQHSINLNNLIYKKNIAELENLKDEYQKLNLRTGEKILLRQVYSILETYINSSIKITTNKKEIRAGEEFELLGTLISDNKVKLNSINLELDHGLSFIEKPKIIDNLSFTCKLKSTISGKLIISLNIICEYNGFKFPLISKKVIEISPGFPIIQLIPKISEYTVKLEKIFFIEYIIKNIGKGEAVDIELSLDFPLALKLIEGKNVKKLHSLGPQEEFSFIFRFKGTVVGKHNIKATLTYNSLEKSEKFPEIIKENDIEIVF